MGVFEELIKYKNMQFIIKLYLWEIGKNKLDVYYQVLWKYKVGKIIKKEMGFYDIFLYVDVVVMQILMVGFEVMLFQKFVLIGKLVGIC